MSAMPSPRFFGTWPNLAKAVAVNIFAVSPVSDGDIRAWPADQGVPLAAVLTYAHVGTLAFANGVIQDLMETHAGFYFAWTLDITEAHRVVASIPFVAGETQH